MTSHDNEVELCALDGSNPLGFLAAVGTLVTVRAAGEGTARLRWHRTFTWTPLLTGVSATDPTHLSDTVAGSLKGSPVPADAEAIHLEAQRAFDVAKKQVMDKRNEIGRRGLRGRERAAMMEAEMRPLEQELKHARSRWLKALAHAVPRPELALGRRIDSSSDEYRMHGHALLTSASALEREPLDLLASFASDACLNRDGMVEATPFCFVTGSGHQYFLETVRLLVDEVRPERVQQTLFQPWTYLDERLSLRWDPLEDRRYALMDRDPTDAANKPRTMWMANLLAYRALVLFPSAPRLGGLNTTAWSDSGGDRVFTWPIWEQPADPDTIRSLLELRELTGPNPDHSALRARGVVSAFRARRIKVGEGPNVKINFSPARAL